MHEKTFVSFLQWHFLIFPFHVMLRKHCVFSVIIAKASGTHLNTSYEDVQNQGTYPKDCLNTYGGKKRCANTCLKNLILCGQMALFWENNKTKTARKQNCLRNAGALKIQFRKRTLPALYLNAIIFISCTLKSLYLKYNVSYEVLIHWLIFYIILCHTFLITDVKGA